MSGSAPDPGRTGVGPARCIMCGREVEVCACCDDPGCEHPCCYMDLVVDLRQTIPQPHTHGG